MGWPRPSDPASRPSLVVLCDPWPNPGCVGAQPASLPTVRGALAWGTHWGWTQWTGGPIHIQVSHTALDVTTRQEGMARVGGVWLATDGQCTVHTLLYCTAMYTSVLHCIITVWFYCTVL